MGKGDDPNCGAAVISASTAGAMDAGDGLDAAARQAVSAWQARVAYDEASEQDRDRLARELRIAEQGLGGRVFRIPGDLLDDFNKRIDKAARNANKNGTMPPLMRVCHRGEEDFTMGGGVSVARDMAYVALAFGDTSAGDGWQFVGHIAHNHRVKGAPADQTNHLRRLPGQEHLDLHAYEDADATCEHCNVRRNRADTFLVQGPDGTVRQVGRSCLGTYTGCATPEQAARNAELVLGVVEDAAKADRRASGWGHKADPNPASTGGWAPGEPDLTDPRTVGKFDPAQYLAFARRSVRQDGWISNKDANQAAAEDRDVTATSEHAIDGLAAALSGEPAAAMPDASDHEYAAEALTWARDHLAAKESHRMTDFQASLNYVLKQERVEYRHLKKLAVVCSMYDRELANRAKVAANPSKHIGTVGQMHETEVTVLNLVERQTASGFDRTIYTLRDADGNNVTWFASGTPKMAVGETHKLRGKVKDHDDFNGALRTVMERCRIIG